MKSIWYARLFIHALACGFTIKGAIDCLRCGGFEIYRIEGYTPLEAIEEELSY